MCYELLGPLSEIVIYHYNLWQVRELPRLEADATVARGVGRTLPHRDGGARGTRRLAPRHHALHTALRAEGFLHHQ